MKNETDLIITGGSVVELTDEPAEPSADVLRLGLSTAPGIGHGVLGLASTTAAGAPLALASNETDR